MSFAVIWILVSIRNFKLYCSKLSLVYFFSTLISSILIKLYLFSKGSEGKECDDDSSKKCQTKYELYYIFATRFGPEGEVKVPFALPIDCECK